MTAIVVIAGSSGARPALREEGDLIRPRRIVVAKPDDHMRLDSHFIRLGQGAESPRHTPER